MEFLEDFKDAMFARPAQVNWTKALASWTCPTDPSNSIGDCDPCGNEAWGNWKHVRWVLLFRLLLSSLFLLFSSNYPDYTTILIFLPSVFPQLGCRGEHLGGGKYRLPGTGDITNVHITDYFVEGPVPLAELCPLITLREIDLDGGNLVGSIPIGFANCFPHLIELDLSYNKLTGSIPGAAIAEVKTLQEFKVDYNQLTGIIPPELMYLPEIHWLRFSANPLQGTLPATLTQTARMLSQLEFHSAGIEGDLKVLANHRLTSFEGRENPRLCGLVPVGVRWASGFNFYGTNLGVPCSVVA